MPFAIIGTLTLMLAIASPSAHALPVATGADVKALMSQRIAKTPGVGMIIGVIDHGKTAVYKAGETGKPSRLDLDTLFEVGSVSKTFTATILASMVLDGSVKLDDPVAKYLPASVRVPSRDGKVITLLDLATQHSGLPRMPSNMDPADQMDPYADYTLADMYKFLNTYSLTRDPGRSFEYSNLGLGLLGDALAARAGVAYSVLLQRRVLGPLGMTDTGIALSADQRSRFAVGHDVDGQAVKPWTFQALAPAGAIRSTLSDMLKYVRCNMGQGPLGRICLFAQHPRSTFPGNRIGLVWWTGDIMPIIHHGGDTAGYHASVAISPDHEIGVVALTNGGTPVDDLAMHVIDPALGVAQWSKVAQLDTATLQSYVGRYDLNAGAGTLTVTRSGGRVFAGLTGQTTVAIYPMTKDVFRYRVVDAQLTFSRDAAGDVSSVVLRQDGQEARGPKLSASAADPATATATPTAATPTPATPAPATQSPNPTPAIDLDQYVGNYVVSAGVIFTISRSDDQLSIRLTGQQAIPIYPTAKDVFNTRMVVATIVFKRDAQGNISALELHQNATVVHAHLSTGALPEPSYPPTVKLDDATLESYLGTYVMSPGAAITVSRTTGQLVVQLTGQPAFPVYASAKDEFFYKVVPRRSHSSATRVEKSRA
jgi:D-alanyl-D-alanine-carboxypeptidase/D-alanyl-D-alanine-endopeptidase